MRRSIRLKLGIKIPQKQKLKWKTSISPQYSYSLIAERTIWYLCSHLKDPNHAELLDYAADFWSAHLDSGNTLDDQAMSELVIKLCDPGSLEFQQWTVNRKRLPSDLDYKFTSPIAVASYLGLEDIVKQLLAADTQPVEWDTYQSWSTLCLAILGGERGIIQLLLEAGAQVNAQQEDGKWRTALFCAVWKFDEDIVKQLLATGAQTDIQDHYGHRALHWAVNRGYEGPVKQLLRRGAQVNKQDVRGEASLTKTMARRDGSIVKLLLEAGADVDIPPDSNGKTPPMLAAY